MQGGFNSWSDRENQSFKQIENNSFNNWGSSYLQSGPFGSSTPLINSGPTSLPASQPQMNLNNSHWYEIDMKSGLRGGGPSSMDMFGQSFNSRRSSNASSQHHSLGSQDWGQILDHALMDEIKDVGSKEWSQILDHAILDEHKDVAAESENKKVSK